MVWAWKQKTACQERPKGQKAKVSDLLSPQEQTNIVHFLNTYKTLFGNAPIAGAGSVSVVGSSGVHLFATLEAFFSDGKAQYDWKAWTSVLKTLEGLRASLPAVLVEPLDPVILKIKTYLCA